MDLIFGRAWCREVGQRFWTLVYIGLASDNEPTQWVWTSDRPDISQRCQTKMLHFLLVVFNCDRKREGLDGKISL